MKKILILLLITTLVSGCFMLPSFASVELGNNESSKAQKVLSDLGIVGKDDLSPTVTRGEYALAVSRVMNIVSMPEGGKLPYSDVGAEDKYYDGIYNLYAWGVISDANRFRPNASITSTEALKIAVSALGYDYVAIEKGGWSSGYIATAALLGIIPKNTGEYITAENAYEILFNMLSCKLSTVSYSDGYNPEYAFKSGDTLLCERWNISEVSGRVTDGETFGINYSSGVGEGFCAIDGMRFNNNGFDTDALFGEEVDVYYENGTDKIRAIYVHSEFGSKTATMYSNQNISYKANTYTYTDENDKERKLKISDDCTIVYNGKNIEFDKSKLVPEYGSVKLVSTDGGDADVVIIKSYTQMVAGSIILNKFLVSDKSSKGHSVLFDDPNISFFNQDEVKINFEDIKENDVLWIEESEDEIINNVLVCSDVIIGEITGTSNKYIYVDGKKYETTASAYADFAANFGMGSVVRACINPDGEIAYFIPEDDSSGFEVGYLIHSKLRSQGLESSIYLKILGSDGLIYEYSMADKFIVNGIVFKQSADENYSRLPKQELDERCMKKSVIAYSVNRYGDVSIINYPDDIAPSFGGEARGLYKNGEITDRTDKYVQYRSYDRSVLSKGFKGRILTTSSYVRFVVPSPIIQETIGAVTTDVKSGPWEDKDYTVRAYGSEQMTNQVHYAYTTTEGGLSSNYIVTMFFGEGSSESHSDSSKLYIVNDVSQVINDDGEEVDKLEVVTPEGTKKEFFSEELDYFNSFKLNLGDLIKVNADSDNKVTGLTVFYRCGQNHLNYASRTEDSAGKVKITLETTLSSMNSKYATSAGECVYNSNSGMGALAESLIMLCNVAAKESTFVYLTPASYDPTDADAPKYPYSMYGKNIVICNMSNETISAGNAGDIKDYESFGTNSDLIVTQANGGVVNAVFVYQ